MLEVSESKISTNQFGPVEFIEKFLLFRGRPFSLYDFQKDIARSSNFLRDKIAIRKGRQVGGSLLVAALIVFYLTTLEYVTVILISKTKDQASLIASYAREFVATSPVLRHLIDSARTNKLDLYLSNNSKMIARSAGMLRADTLRGHSVQGRGFLCFDESAYIPADAIRNTYYAAAGGCGVVHCSTPYRPLGAFYDACHSPRFKTFHVPCKLSPRITADDLAFWREDMPASKYANEVLADFAQGEDSVFSPDLIDAAVDSNLPLWPGPFRGDTERSYVYSLDPSRIGSDKWALTIGELNKGILSIAAHHAWAGSESESDYVETTNDPDAIIDTILRYHKTGFPCAKFFCDTTTNEYFAHRLQNKYLLPVEPVVWSTSRKEKLISHLETVLKTGRLRLPNSDAMRRELLCYSFDWQRMKDHEERKLYLSGEDDWVASLAMIAQAISIRKEFNFKDILRWR